MPMMHYSWVYTGKANIGEGHTGRYVPAVGTLIDDKDTGFCSQCGPGHAAVHAGTLVTTGACGSHGGRLHAGVGPRFPSQGYFIVNNETVPAVLRVDSGFYTRFPGTSTSASLPGTRRCQVRKFSRGFTTPTTPTPVTVFRPSSSSTRRAYRPGYQMRRGRNGRWWTGNRCSW
jgi:hypothetical protein